MDSLVFVLDIFIKIFVIIEIICLFFWLEDRYI